ncbi:hypothetical protein COV20_05595 [Candidatus Woesearchaeota archaeon CG10_big_fil_rev_8_21_14_0_10_45_16]|nr:MAG: hypothetical protein COV20_05595 [Candidatus Woesearchaeota archaeon CG10_big_fil_rev_8_21_14_0_10_45_16]
MSEAIVPEQPAVIEEPQETAPVSCVYDNECPQGDLCIDSSCQKLDDLYAGNCEKKCSFKSATLLTSDGETLTLKKSQGSYTAAGAVEWKVISFPDYCPGSFKLPVKVLMKNAGKVLGEYALLLDEGQSSQAIKHPTISRVNFQLTLTDVEEEC